MSNSSLKILNIQDYKLNQRLQLYTLWRIYYMLDVDLIVTCHMLSQVSIQVTWLVEAFDTTKVTTS